LETEAISAEGDLREIATDYPVNLNRLKHITGLPEKAV
jgi:hypothetical protein